MHPLWEIFWSDAVALAGFTIPMLVLALPASLLAALLGGVHYGVGSWRRFVLSALRGLFLGTVVALAVSMSIELMLTVEGFAHIRWAMRSAANWQLLVSGPLLAFLFAFLAARRYAPVPGQPQRRYSLRELFVYQLIAASLFGWWTFTRRSEIVQRKSLLEWQIRERDAKAVFEPLGWQVETSPQSDEIALLAATHYRPVSDESLAPVPVHGAVTLVSLRSDSITDEGLKRLRGANRLRRLIVASEQITDEGVESLVDLPRLRYLDIHSSHLTGQSLQSLAQIKSLRFLTITRGSITDDEIAAFRQSRPGLYLRVIE